MAEIEAGPVPQPTNIDVGFTETDPEEAAIEKQLLEAEKNGTSFGDIEDAEKVEKVKPGEEPKDEKTEDGNSEVKPDNSETPAEKQERELARDEKTGQFKKGASEFEKAKKEKDRLTKGWGEFEAQCKSSGIDVEALNTGKRTWQDLDRCKGFVRKQIDAAVANERAQLDTERSRMQEQARNRGEFSPQEFHKAANEFQAAAFKALSSNDPEEVLKAKELFANANSCMQAAQRTWEYTLVQSREKDVTDTVRKHPELEDINSEAGQAMMQLLKENPYLAQLPNGFSKAAKFLVAQRDAARIPELEGQLKESNKERDEARAQLKAATSLAGAGSQTQPGARNFDDMSEKEQEREVERQFSDSGEFVHA
jgi:hypothetical protein